MFTKVSTTRILIKYRPCILVGQETWRGLEGLSVRTMWGVEASTMTAVWDVVVGQGLLTVALLDVYPLAVAFWNLVCGAVTSGWVQFDISKCTGIFTMYKNSNINVASQILRFWLFSKNALCKLNALPWYKLCHPTAFGIIMFLGCPPAVKPQFFTAAN